MPLFINFENVTSTSRKKPPFGIGQIGKSFRNEITPGNFIFRTRELISELKAGATVLVVSDAGMPTISDPGFRLMRDAISEGIEVSVIPGPIRITSNRCLHLYLDRLVYL